MSERKDAEIKFRVTSTEKARWQQLAEERRVSLSTLIRASVNREVFLGRVSKADAERSSSTEAFCPCPKETPARLVGDAAFCNECDLEVAPASDFTFPDTAPWVARTEKLLAGEDPDASPQEDVSSDEPGLPKEDADRLVSEGKASWARAPWMFEAQNG